VSDSFNAPKFWLKELRESTRPRVGGKSQLVVADLFSGCGGLTLGALYAAKALRRSIRIELAVDSWKPAFECYRDNFAGLIHVSRCEDVKRSMKMQVGPIDVLLAGPPCQGHSNLNNSSRRSDARNSLYLAPVRFAVVNTPSLVIIENVPSVVHSKERVVEKATALLRNCGYAVLGSVVDTSMLGLPQRRKRHILLGSRIHTEETLRLAAGQAVCGSHVPRVIDFIDDLVDVVDDSRAEFRRAKTSAANRKRIEYLFANDKYDLPNRLRPPCHRDKTHSYVSMYGRMRPDAPAQTITSGFGSMGQGRFVHPTRPRMLTCREAARIQGFPDFFSFGKGATLGQLRDMIANAVPPALSAALIIALLRPESEARRC
jgi:DNA (cytosine-5)-methyltransferase 1